jgi:hypothetical protein
MQNLDQTRRATDNAGALASAATTDIVRHGILLRHAASTVAAVEYLTARDVDATVIRRVMSGSGLREPDRMALALQREAAGHAPVR